MTTPDLPPQGYMPPSRRTWRQRIRGWLPWCRIYRNTADWRYHRTDPPIARLELRAGWGDFQVGLVSGAPLGLAAWWRYELVASRAWAAGSFA